MHYRVVESVYGPDIRANDWRVEGGGSAYAGGVLQLQATEQMAARWCYHGKGRGGDVALGLTFSLERVTDDTRFEARFNTRSSADEPSGFRFVFHRDRMALFLADQELFVRNVPAARFRRPRQLRLVTVADSYAFGLDGRVLAEGTTGAGAAANEGEVLLCVSSADVEVASLTEELVTHDVDFPPWSRGRLLYREAFGRSSLNRNWVCNGEAPECHADAFVFNFMSVSVLRRRFSGPLAVGFTATPLPAPRWLTAGVSDAIFMWMVDKPGGDLSAFMQALPDAELRHYVPLPLYWVDFGGSNNVTTRLRRNPGRRLIRHFGDRARLLERGRSYAITLVQNGTFVEFWVDGQPWIQTHDPQPLTSGHVGFRAYIADLKIGDLRIWRLK